MTNWPSCASAFTERDKAALSHVRKIVASFQSSDWNDIHLITNDVEIQLSSTPSSGVTELDPMPARRSGQTSPRPSSTDDADSVDRESAADEPVTEGAILVEAPSVGVFWRSPKPGAPPFAQVGDRVETSTTLCIVEVMKLMTNVHASCAGTITRVLVENGEHISQDQPLFEIVPDSDLAAAEVPT